MLRLVHDTARWWEPRVASERRLDESTDNRGPGFGPRKEGRGRGDTSAQAAGDEDTPGEPWRVQLLITGPWMGRSHL